MLSNNILRHILTNRMKINNSVESKEFKSLRLGMSSNSEVLTISVPIQIHLETSK